VWLESRERSGLNLGEMLNLGLVIRLVLSLEYLLVFYCWLESRFELDYVMVKVMGMA
jgi:hypothetical protein